MTLCPHCGDWPVDLASDRFCGGCGAFVEPNDVTLVAAVSERGVLQLALAGRGVERAGVPAAKVAVLRRSDAVETALPDDQDAIIAIDEAGPRDLFRATQLARLAGYPLTLVVRAVTADGHAPNALAWFTANQLPIDIRWSGDAIDARAVVADPDGRGGRLPIAITVAGGAAVAVAVRLKLDGDIGALEDGPRLPAAQLLEAGPTVVEAWVSAPERETLATRLGKLRGRLEIVVRAPRGGPDLPLPPVRVQTIRTGPAKLEFRVKSATIRAMSGRRARLAASLTNIGGRTICVTRIEARLYPLGGDAAEAVPEALQVPFFWEQGLAPGEPPAYAELRPLMATGATAGGEIAPGRYQCSLTLKYTVVETGVTASCPARIAAIDVCPREAFNGRVCIDFGTTESAAAAIRGGAGGPGPVVPEAGDEAPEAPLVINLGRVAMSDEEPDSGQRFLETLAVTVNGDFWVGDEALRRIARLENAVEERDRQSGGTNGAHSPAARDTGADEDFRVLSDLKWTDDPDARASREAYLRHVKGLIEDHPAIAAEISSETIFYATKPTRFGEARGEMLRNAFTAAGFPDPATELFDTQAPSLIAESWPPLPYVLVAADEPFARLRGGSDDPPKRDVLPHQLLEPGYIIVYDVGGGSADLAIMRIRDADGIRDVREIATYTDVDFVGRCFEDVIRRALVDVIDQRLGRACRPDNKRQRGKAQWKRAVAALQHDRGLLTPFGDAIRTFLRDELNPGQAVRRDRLAAIETVVEQLATSAVATERAQIAPYLPLSLPLLDDGDFQLGADALPAIVTQVIDRFAQRYAANAVKFNATLLAEAMKNDPDFKTLIDQKGDSTRLRIVPSGRGASCPMADAMLFILWEPFKQGTLRLLPLEAKSITSWGGLWLADMFDLRWNLRFEHTDTRSTPHVLIARGRGAPPPRPLAPGPRPGLWTIRLSDLGRDLESATRGGRIEAVACSGGTSEQRPLGSDKVPAGARDRQWLIVDTSVPTTAAVRVISAGTIGEAAAQWGHR